MERKQFTFYDSFAKAAERIRKKADRCEFYDAVIHYALYGTEPDFDTLPNKVAVAFECVRDILDTEIRQSIEGRRCAEYKVWRTAVFERDAYTCRECGAHGVRLNAHHILQYAYFPDLRFSVDNGETLCVACHKKRHRRRV